MTAAQALFLSPAQAAELLGCSDETVRQMIKRGELKAEHRGRNYRVPVSEIEKRAGQRLAAAPDGRKQALMTEYLELQARMTTVVSELARL